MPNSDWIKEYVIQVRLPSKWGDEESSDLYVSMKLELDRVLADANEGEVDGGDYGSGTFNVFVFPRTLNRSLAAIKRYLRGRELLDRCVIAKRLWKSDDDWDYEVVWPKDYQGKFSIW
jgi:hypothetical protein